MTGKYMYESFSADISSFDSRFTQYLNKKYADHWKVKYCDFSVDGGDKSASCLFSLHS